MSARQSEYVLGWHVTSNSSVRTRATDSVRRSGRDPKRWVEEKREKIQRRRLEGQDVHERQRRDAKVGKSAEAGRTYVLASLEVWTLFLVSINSGRVHHNYCH